MNRKLFLRLFFVSALFCTGWAQASLIGVNFIGGDNNNNAQGGTLAPTDTAGAVLPGLDLRQSNWNNFLAPNVVNGSLNGLVDRTGTATTADITVSGVNNLWDTNGSTATPDGALMRGYLDTTGSSTTSISVTDVPYAEYSVALYFTGSTGRSGIYTVNGDSKIGRGSGAFSSYSLADGLGSTGNVLVYTGLTGDLSITATPGGGFGNFRAPLQGFSIFVPEPSTALGILGLMSGTFLRRKRRLLK